MTMEAVASKLATADHFGVSAFSVEDLITLEFQLGQLGLAAAPLVKFAVGRNHGAQELRNGFAHLFGGNTSFAKGVAEPLRILGIASQSVFCLCPRQVHFVGVGNGIQNLLLKGSGASVPEEVLYPSHVDKGHRIAGALSSVNTCRNGIGVGKGKGGQMATSAADAAVRAQSGFPKEQPAQFHPLYRHGVVRRNVHWRKKRRNVNDIRGGARRLLAFDGFIGSATSGGQQSTRQAPQREALGMSGGH